MIETKKETDVQIMPASKTYCTRDYGKFKRLTGNRKLTSARATKIKNSILKIGYIPVPIVVNEKCEVIDGQGRLSVISELGLPLYYIVVPGLGIEDCIAMNIGLENWCLRDYVESYAETGDLSYIRLLNLLKEYKDKKQRYEKNILCIACGLIDYVPNDAIKKGKIEISDDEYKRALNMLEWLSSFSEILNRIRGNVSSYYSALAFCYTDPAVDNERLEQKMYMMQADLIPASNVLQALGIIENVYNHKIRNKVYIKTRYRECLEGKYKWYKARYSNRYE